MNPYLSPEAHADALATAQEWARDSGLKTLDWRTMDADLWRNINVALSPDGRMLILSYSDRAVYEARWTPLERICRGLVLEIGTGRVLARPWPKFFNWSELDEEVRIALGGLTPLAVSGKVDGSLGILFHDGADWRICTRGSFVSEQAIWATKELHSGRYDLDTLPAGGWTYLCEIVMPGNRIVIGHQPRDYGLVLLDVISNHDGGVALTQEYSRRIGARQGFLLPDTVPVDERVLTLLLAGQEMAQDIEGWVAVWDDGTMVKFKTRWYLDRHKLFSSFGPEKVRQAFLLRAGAEYRLTLPEELWPEYDHLSGIVSDRYWFQKGLVQGTHLRLKHLDTGGTAGRREFAFAVLAEDPTLRPFLFMEHDGKDYREKLIRSLDLSDVTSAVAGTSEGEDGD